MSYPINKNINPAINPAYPQPMTSGAIALPLDTDKVAQTVTSNSALKPPTDSPLETLGITVAAMPAIWYGVNKFNKACRGDDYSKTILGRLGTWGDKIQGVIPESITGAIGRAYTTSRNLLDEKVIKKVSVLNSFFHNKSKPSSSMVLSISGGTQTELSTHIVSVLKEIGETDKKGKLLEVLGKIPELKDLQITDIKDIDKLAKIAHTEDGMNKVTKICEELAKTKELSTHVPKQAWGIPFSDKIFKQKKYISDIPGLKKVLCQEAYFSELLNKLNALRGQGKDIAKTALGKFFSKFSIRSMEGLVNGNTAGIFGLFLGAYFVGESIKKAIHAPKGEKGKTFAEHNIYNLGWYLTMPLGMSIMHGLGGLQYIGMSKEQVSKYRDELEKLNKLAETGNITKDLHKAKVKELKEMLKGETALKTAKTTGGKFLVGLKNILHKPLKLVGRTIAVGLETIRPYKSGKKFADFITHIPYYLKKGAGWPMRFGLFMFLIAPPLGKLGAKVSHMIFGKPTHSVLDEGKEPEKEKASQAEIQQMANQLQAQPMGQGVSQSSEPQSVMNPINAQVPAQAVAGDYKPQNMITMYAQNKAAAATVPSEPARSYVPSPEAARFDNTTEQQEPADEKVMEALRKADALERRIH